MSADLITGAVLAAGALVAAVWQGLLLALAVGLALRMLPAISAAARSAVWLGTFVVAVGLEFEPLLVGSPRVAGVGHAVHLGLPWSLAVAMLWTCFSAIRGGQLVVSALHLRRLGRESRVVASLDLTLPRGARVCVSDEVDRPCVAGFLRPRILFPPALLAGLSAAELEQVLLHETEHLRRGDDWTNLAQKLALVVFPLNPVLLWVERRLCAERELACDDRVLRVTGAPKAYATTLTNLAEHTVLTRGLSLALGAWERRSELASRVYRMLTRPERTLSPGRSAAISGAMLAGVLAAAVVLAHAPAVVSFLPQVEAADTSAAMVPMSVRASGAHLQLAKAVLPMRGASATAAMRPLRMVGHRTMRRSRVPAGSRAVTLRALRVPSRWTLAMAETSAEQGSTHDSVAVMDGEQSFAVRERRSSPAVGREHEVGFVQVVRYAAVPVPGGWLLFQL